MIFEEEKYTLGKRDIVLRSAHEDEADMLVDYLKTVCGETNFLLVNPDEVKYTTEDEIKFIKHHNEAEDALVMCAFVDGEYAGNCSFTSRGSSRRAKHRADIGIALFQKYTGFGLGRLMLERLIQKIKDCGFTILDSDYGLFIGIDGAGYDFYEKHWTPLYDAFGFKWHTN